MKILLAIDGSKFSKKMLAYITTHEALFKGDNTFALLTVQSPLPNRARAAVGKDVVHSYYSEEAEKVLAPVIKFLEKRDIKAKSEWKVGAVGETISKVAQDGEFDLVVMGSHGHSALGNLVMGSVATQVLAHCKVPVLLVR